MPGDAVSVVAKLEGTGNLPATLKLPSRHGVEWLEPTLFDNIDVNGTTVGGFRKFSYIVRVSEAGAIDLGELSLPYWDPDREAYGIAKVSLGRVDVKADPKRKTDEINAKAPAKLTLKARPDLGEPSTSTSYLTDKAWYWGFLLFGPLVVLSWGAARNGFSKLKTRRRLKRQSAAYRSEDALRNALSAAKKGDQETTLSEIERALYAGVEENYDLAGRSLVRDKLRDELDHRDVPNEVSTELVLLLDACESTRFGGEEAGSIQELAKRAQTLLTSMKRGSEN